MPRRLSLLRSRSVIVFLLFALAAAQQDRLPARTWLIDCVGGSDNVNCGWKEGPCGTIQFALDRAANGDRIDVLPGVCKGTGNFDLRFRGLQVVLTGRGYAAATGPAVEISCDGKGRAFRFEHHEGILTRVQDMVVRDCQADYGGAVWCDNASPVLERLVLRNNRAALAGGAIYWHQRGPVTHNLIFDANTADAYGPDQASSFTKVEVEGFPLKAYTSGDFFPDAGGLRASLRDNYGQEKAECTNIPTDTMVGILLLEQLVATSQGMTLRLAIAAQAGPAPTPRRPKKNQKYLGTVAGIVGSPYSGSICPGGHEIECMPGFYIESRVPLTVTACPQPQHCLGGRNSDCAEGHSGALCMGCVGGLSHCMDGSCVQGVCPEVVIGLSVFFGAAAAALVFQRWWIQSDSNLLIDALLRHNDKSRRLRRKKDDDASGSDSDVPDDDDDGADGADTLLLVNRPDPRHASRRGGGRAAVGAGAGGTELRHMAGDVSGKTGGKSEGVRRQASLSLPAKAADVHVGSKKGEHRGQREAGHGEMTADTRRVMQGSLVEAGWGDHADGEEDMDMVLHEPQGLVLGEVEGKDIDRPGSEWAAQRQGQAGAPRGKQSSARARARVGGEGDRGRGVLRDRARRDQGIAGQGEGEEGAAEGTAEGGRDLEEGMVVDGGSSDDDRGWGRAGAEEVVGAAKQLMTRFRLGSLAAIKKDSASKGGYAKVSSHASSRSPPRGEGTEMQCSSEASRRVPFAYNGTPGQGTASKVASTRHSRRRRALERPEDDTLGSAASEAEQERQTLGQIDATGASGSGGSAGGAAFNMLAMLAAAAGGVASRAGGDRDEDNGRAPLIGDSTAASIGDSSAPLTVGVEMQRRRGPSGGQLEAQRERVADPESLATASPVDVSEVAPRLGSLCVDDPTDNARSGAAFNLSAMLQAAAGDTSQEDEGSLS